MATSHAISFPMLEVGNLLRMHINKPRYRQIHPISRKERNSTTKQRNLYLRNDPKFNFFSFARSMWPEGAHSITKTTKRPQTAGTLFKTSMQSLMKTLASKEPYYVRCIKPNELKSPHAFDEERVIHQIRCASGFPVSEFEKSKKNKIVSTARAFWNRYRFFGFWK